MPRERLAGRLQQFFASATLKPADLNPILRYVTAIETARIDPSSRSRRSRMSTDPILRERVERIAVEVVIAHFESLDCTVESVEDGNKGWDLEARNKSRELRIEVKGRASVGQVELTPREYSAMCNRKGQAIYRLAIVHWCLTGNPTLRVFQHNKALDKWFDEKGNELTVTAKIGALADF